MSDKTEEKAKQLYLAGGWTYATLANKFKVSERTIIRWSKAGNWQGLRDSEAIACSTIAAEVSVELNKPIPPKSVRHAIKEMDKDAIMDAAIASLSSAAPDAEIKSQEAAYGQLIKIMQVRQQMKHQERMQQLEYELKEADLILKRRQITPPTPKEWAEAAVIYKLDPIELLEYLKKAVGM